MTGRNIAAQCAIVGGGPAGLMLGVLLARSGVSVVVLEKHADFLRDFRGDTVHPSTLQVMHELGWLASFLKIPHQRLPRVSGRIGDSIYPIADFSHLPTAAKFIAMMPQWDFLDFLADKGRQYPGFRLLMETHGDNLIRDGNRVTGVVAHDGEGALEIRADLVVACDGRHSDMRRDAGMVADDLGAPMDVLWFRLPRTDGDQPESLGRFESGQIIVLINRGDYWQCAYVIAKGGIDKVKARGLDAFRADVARLVDIDRARTDVITSWDDVKLLTVRVDRLKRWWQPGFLCIGDAAHAMSPIGGVGVNLAIQDAVAAANILAEPLREARVGDADLAAVESRRQWPTKVTQRLQLIAQNRIIGPTLQAKGPLSAPLPMRLLSALPVLQRIPARLIGMGIRPEHVAARERATA